MNYSTIQPRAMAAEHQPYASFRIKDFRLYLSARLFLTMALQMQAVIVGWQVYSFTKDPLSLGLIGLAEAVPYIIASLFGGHVADTVNRKKLIISFSLLLLMCSTALFYFTLPISHILEKYHTIPIYIIIFLIGIGRGFLAPAITAFFAQIVPRNLFANGITWISNAWQLAAIAGPAIGGLLYGFAGIGWAYGVLCVFLLVNCSLFLLIPSRPLPESGRKEPLLKGLTAGVRFVFSRPVILGTLSLDLFAVLFGGAVAMLPVFAAEILLVGPEGLGILRAAPFVGSVLTGFFIAHRPPMMKAGINLLLAIAGFGLATICFAVSVNFYLSLFLLMLTGAFDNVSVIIRGTILQLLTPDHMRGRVSAVNNVFVGSSNEIGAFESGLAAKLMGLVPSVIFGGTMTILIVMVTAWLSPAIRKLNMRELQEHPEEAA